MKQKSLLVYVKFIAITVVSALFGGAFGYAVAAGAVDFAALSRVLNGAMASGGLWWFAPGFLALAVSSVLYHKAKVLLPRAAEEDQAFEQADRLLCLSLLWATVSVPWLIISIGIGFTGTTDVWVLLLLGLIVAYVVWVTILQTLVISATKAIHPEKRGNVFDTRFRKEWFQSCDEAEQQQIGQCAYRTFQVMNGAFTVLAVALCLLALAGVVTPLWMLVFGGLWLLQNLVYTYTAYRTSHAVL